jgi:hypothetical protein
MQDFALKMQDFAPDLFIKEDIFVLLIFSQLNFFYEKDFFIDGTFPGLPFLFTDGPILCGWYQLHLQIIQVQRYQHDLGTHRKFQL